MKMSAVAKLAVAKPSTQTQTNKHKCATDSVDDDDDINSVSGWNGLSFIISTKKKRNIFTFSLFCINSVSGWDGLSWQNPQV